MTGYVALLRAVNVGGRKLLMTDLKSIADELGLADARTFIASGNLLFASEEREPELRDMLDTRLTGHMGKRVDVLIRTAAELADVVANNPFADQPGNRVGAIFLNRPPAADALERVRHQADERMALGTREIFVHYPNGMGPSKLQIPAAAEGTMRNMNSVARLAELAREMA